MPENHFFGEPTNTPEAHPHVAGATQGSVRGGGAVETAAPQGRYRQPPPTPIPAPPFSFPKSKPSKVSSNPSGLLIVALIVAIFWIGFIAGWLARAHG